MSQADKPNHTSKKAAGRPKEKQNRISDLERGHAHASAGRGDKPGSGKADPTAKPASTRSSSSTPASLQPPRSDAPAGTPAGSGNSQGNENEGSRSYDIQGKPAARADAEPQRKPPKAAAGKGAAPADPGALRKPTQPSSKGQNSGMPEARAPDNTLVSDTGRGAQDTEKKKPSLSFAQGAAPLDSSPAQRPPSHDGANHETTGDANLTSHLNDPAMRRAPPTGPAPGSVGASHSDISPLARDGVTPADEEAKHAQDAHDADQRGRLKGMQPREDVEGWRESEKEWQSDLPGQPRKL